MPEPRRRSTSAKASPTGAARSFSSHGRRTSPSSMTASAFACCAPCPIDGEGWGLTHDGSAPHPQRRHRHPALPRSRNLQASPRRSPSRKTAIPSPNLNELEFIHGEIYANIWHTDRIVRISPATGKVLGSIDLTGLLPRTSAPIPSRPQRHRLRRRPRPPLRHRQALAKACSRSKSSPKNIR